MRKVMKAEGRILRLSATHGVDPQAVVALLSLHALADIDFRRLELWKDVSRRLQERAMQAA